MTKRIFFLLTLFAVSLGYRYGYDVLVPPSADVTTVSAAKSRPAQSYRQAKLAKKRIVYVKAYSPPAYEESAPSVLRVFQRFVPAASRAFFYATPYTDLSLRSPPTVR